LHAQKNFSWQPHLVVQNHIPLEKITCREIKKNKKWYWAGLIIADTDYCLGNTGKRFSGGVSIGLPALFKTYLNHTGRLMQMLAGKAYGAYIFHVPVVVAPFNQ
jgi:hypothetical protein